MTFLPNNDDRFWKESRQKGWFRFPTPLRYIVFMIILVCLVVVLWYLLSPARRSYNNADLALIQADESPFKVKAKDQGLPQIKHQDKLVYGRIRSDQNAPAVEHILPEPESPSAQIKEDPPALKMVDEYRPENSELEKGANSFSEKSIDTPHAIASIEDLIDELPEEKPMVKKKGTKGNTLIQLGSLKSYDTAESEWKRISGKHKDILSEFEPTIQKVDLGATQGIYFRLRTGPFESDEEAKKACATLQERKVECLVIH